VAILGDPNPEETAAIVAALEVLARDASGPSAQPAPSKWRAAARSLDDARDPWA
jgi:hypothetical protein